MSILEDWVTTSSISTSVFLAVAAGRREMILALSIPGSRVTWLYLSCLGHRHLLYILGFRNPEYPLEFLKGQIARR
jgi:hypothetical protein